MFVHPIKMLKGIYGMLNSDSSNFGRNWRLFPVKDHANALIYNMIMDDKPAMIARLGANELSTMVNYLGIHQKDKYKSIKKYITGKTPEWWWNKGIMRQMEDIAGFFPSTPSNLVKFSEMMIRDLNKVDLLGSWLKEEDFFKKELVGARRVMLEDLEPFFTDKPWTWALEGKRVLVVHPFADQIQEQYLMHDKLFDNGLLPKFTLLTLQAVQSLAGEKTPYKDWFDALDAMKAQISEIDFDVCILGCGAYGFPLASYIKDLGKKAIHLGGVTQLLFGIKGARWETYIVYPYMNLYNQYWVRPGEKYRPKNADVVEGACYW